ncbi:Nodulin-like domain-containing protein [Trichophyton interdigitale]|nr:Nodulin-like domain-containing protein [Trichophyton interdigitale]KAG5218431.1 Nodulin-like domain-containing protein [Trichophyton interdigitale]KAG8206888.1 Nodulin-like domain-containing protein [Trichophyton interdigitale]
MAPPIPYITPTAFRFMTVVAGTLVALASGTNYVYSAWAPQFADRLKLTSTDGNMIGAAGNVGVYAVGIPIGYIVDTKGTRLVALFGAISLFCGYFPIHLAYVAGAGSLSVVLLCFFSFLSGVGSCAAFAAAIKTAANNFPDHRGSATAFPLAAFGLSAFGFSAISAMAFKDDTSEFLLLLALGPSLIIVVCTYFLQLLPPPPSYSAILNGEYPDSNLLQRTKPAENIQEDSETDSNRAIASFSSAQVTAVLPSAIQPRPTPPDAEADETSSLMSRPRSLSDSGSFSQYDQAKHNAHAAGPDIRGLSLLPTPEFWQLFLLLGISTGVGLMTINNIGNDVMALWRHVNPDVDSHFLREQQALHVSVFSVISFTGRLLSGIGSDFIVKRLHMSRFWCVFVASILFCISQLGGAKISSPHYLIFVSSMTGLAYGVLFGVYPAIVSHAFGISGFSQNWGVMTLAAAIFGHIFNYVYGVIYDSHSKVLPDGTRQCSMGLECYSTAYLVAFYASISSGFLTLVGVFLERYRRHQMLLTEEDDIPQQAA